VPDSLVRLALELAFEVGRLGSRATPPLEAPRPLRPFLGFARLPDRALAAVRKALDDEEFLARVASVAEVPAAAEQLDRASMLFLTRPEGWTEELDALAATASAAAEEERAARDDRSATRRAERAEAAARRAEEAAQRARRELARVEPALAEERRLRRAAEQALTRTARELAAANERALAAAAEVAEVREQLVAIAGQRDELERRLASAASPAPVLPDPAPARAALVAARSAAGDLHRALEEAAAALLPPGVGGAVPAAPAPPPTRSVAASSRRPLVLPPAVFDDSPEAAAHLVRAPGALLLVDGYNAAMAIWPGLDVTEIRLRLIDALTELAARTGVRVHVVFDGADLAGAVPPPRSGPVRVSFSDAGTEADDVILALVESLPTSVPVLVASSDRRVQDGARGLGANILSSGQLGAVLGR
jgi:predicted RNA-binding protein with PIN domain